MSVAKLKITKGGVSGTLILGMFKDHTWRLEAPVSWFPANSGKWNRVRNATKFRQFSFLRLADGAGKDVLDLPEPPYTQGQKFTANLVEHVWMFEVSGDPIDVEVMACPPATKDFEISETWAGSLSVWLGQVEAAGMTIKDLTTNATETYVYKGAGLTFGLPKLPKILQGKVSQGSATTTGPANPFTAPGYLGAEDFEGDATMQTFYNLGLGTDKSKNAFDFGGNVDNLPGFLVRILDFSTGRTLSLPSAGFSSGSMTLLRNMAGGSPTPPATGGRGKFGGASGTAGMGDDAKGSGKL